MPSKHNKPSTAVWAITPNGMRLAEKILSKISDADVYLSENLSVNTHMSSIRFDRLSEVISKRFFGYRSHVFIMATGIVVRTIAPHLQHKTSDPAVVVVDESGQWAVSLLSGHIGGANRLARDVAEIIGAQSVITTATDMNNVPAIDMLAMEGDLFIENPEAIKTVNMALLTRNGVVCQDPGGFIKDRIPDSLLLKDSEPHDSNANADFHHRFQNAAGVYVDDIVVDLPENVLILRPKSLAAGIGCNRNTPMEEIKALLLDTLEAHQLALRSLDCLGSISVKSEEAGLIALADHLGLPLTFFDRDQLNGVEEIETPSTIVEKHVGVRSVCEAAAILAAGKGTLIVPKHSTKNVTVAIARKPYIS